jgi:two-component system response regulator YesN
MKHTSRSARAHLLRIFDNKLGMLLNESGIVYQKPALYNSDDDTAILRYYSDLLEKWYLAGATAASSAVPDAIEQSCRYIKDHFREELTLSEMAERTNFSVSHFSTLFKKHTGSSFVNYVNGLKVDEAKKLLRSTAYSVAEIAEMAGFSTTPYFSRVFKSTAGLTPLEYRKRMGS